MPKLKFDLALAEHDEIVYGIPENDDGGRGKALLLHGVGAVEVEPDSDSLYVYERVPKGTEVTVKLTLDEGTAIGSRRLVIVVGETEVFTGDWALEP